MTPQIQDSKLVKKAERIRKKREQLAKAMEADRQLAKKIFEEKLRRASR
jgi:predicted ATP-grasp superfamily ATP-dependent carboligase